MGLISSPYNDDITIHCKVRHLQQGRLMNKQATEMLLTLRHWHRDDCTSSHEILFVGPQQEVPELLFRPLPQFPTKFRNGHVFCTVEDKIACRLSLTDILNVRFNTTDKATTIVLDLPYQQSMELDCLTRNGADLVGAALQSRLPPTRWRRHAPQPLAATTTTTTNNTTTATASSHTISPCGSVDDNNSNIDNNDQPIQEEYTVDMLTAACMRATAAQESLGDKLQRRWGKAVHDLTLIMEGSNERMSPTT